MPNKFLSIFNVGGVDYNLKDAVATAKLEKLLGKQTLQELGAAAWKAVATEVTGGGEALPTAEAVKSYVTSQVGQIHSFDVVIDPAGTADGPSVAASADTMYKIYMVADVQASAGTYIEWITIRSGAKGAYTYAWEKIGSTKTDLTGYVSKETTIATIPIMVSKLPIITFRSPRRLLVSLLIRTSLLPSFRLHLSLRLSHMPQRALPLLPLRP